jgi:predicted dehydrogenase
MTSQPRQTRRQFLRTSAKAAAAGTVVSQLPISRFAHAAGSDTIRLGLIGCGRRGTGVATDALNVGPQVRLVAMGDVFEGHIENRLQSLRQKHTSRVDVPRERWFVGFDAYKRVLQSGVDLVIDATPPGFRPLHFEAAVQAGKHVFMEKQSAVDAPGIRKVLAAGQLAKQKSLKVGAGFQFRHDRTVAETVRRVQDSEIGRIRAMEAYYLSGARPGQRREPGQSEMEYQIKNWFNLVWLGGDIIDSLGVHYLNICHWIKGSHPARARGTGGRKERFGPDHGEIFDHFRIEYTYDDGTPLLAECSMFQSGGKRQEARITGTLGTAETRSGRIEGQTNWQYEGAKSEPNVAQQTALLDAIRNDKPFNEAEDGAMSTMIAIMGRMAAYEGREITWDEAINSNETDVPERCAWDMVPPTLPDKFGDYVVPARGKRA